MEHLIGRARSGDQGAREELFKRCRPMLARWSRQRLDHSQPGGDRPSDIVQEAAMRAFSRFETFNGTTEEEWNTWLRSIVNNCANQAFRDAGRKKRDTAGHVSLDSPSAMAAPAVQTSASQTFAFKETWHQLLARIYHLTEGQRTAIRLCHLEELPVAEVARQMAKTEDAVAGLLQRGLAALQEVMVAPAEEAARGRASTSRPTSDAAAIWLVFLKRRDAGEAIDHRAFLAEHPACAAELASMLQWIERIQALRPRASKS